MRRHVFISYRHDDKSASYVERLAGHLSINIVPSWYDREIVSGDRWSRVLRHQVDTCAALIVVMTPAAEDSEWIEREIVRAQQQGKPILPLLLSGKAFFRLNDLHYEDVTNGRMPSASYVAKLRNHVQEANHPAATAKSPGPGRSVSAGDQRAVGRAQTIIMRILAAILGVISLSAIATGGFLHSTLIIVVSTVFLLASMALMSRRFRSAVSRLLHGFE